MVILIFRNRAEIGSKSFILLTSKAEEESTEHIHKERSHRLTAILVLNFKS